MVSIGSSLFHCSLRFLTSYVLKDNNLQNGKLALILAFPIVSAIICDGFGALQITEPPSTGVEQEPLQRR